MPRYMDHPFVSFALRCLLLPSLLANRGYLRIQKRVDQRSLPRVVSGLTGGLLEGSHVEAGDVGLGPVGRSQCSVGGGVEASVTRLHRRRGTTECHCHTL